MSNPPRAVNLRHYPRRRVAWPVTVQADTSLLHGETLDVGPQGAKLRLTERLDVGTRVTLHFAPSEGPSTAVEAIVWRIDDDGLAFFFLSPRFTADAPGDALTDKRTATRSSNLAETILVVDDEPEVLSTIGDALEAEGYKVLKTLDPFEALRLARTSSETIQLLLTDVVMPLMNGVKLADELRSIRPGVKVLFMSAYTTEQVGDYGVGLVPGVPLLVKPFGLAELSSKVRAVLDYRSPFERKQGRSTPRPKTT